MAVLGILGIGHLAGFLVEGLCAAEVGVEIILSPRNPDKAAQLAELHGLRTAESNQALVDQSDLVLVCLPARTGRDILQGLTFRPGQSVLSAMAGSGQSQLVPLVAPAQAHVTMMPGAANALGCGPSLLYPEDSRWHQLLSALGPVIATESEEQFDIAAVFGGFSGASFSWMNATVQWFQRQGLPPEMAQRLVAATLRGNAEVALQPGVTLDEISTGVATPGGITRQLVDHLDGRGALEAWDSGLSAVLARMQAD